MRCKGISLVTIVIFLVTFAGNVFGAGGDMGLGTDPCTNGSVDHPYLIEDITDFNNFSNDPNYWAVGVYTRLDTDIDLAGDVYSRAVIDPYFNSPDFIPFSGVFDGNDNVVRNMTIDTNGVSNGYLGLFGCIGDSNAQVTNLGVIDVNIIGGGFTGGFCGSNGYLQELSGGNIINCYTTGAIMQTGGQWSGGLCGWNYNGEISECYSTVKITGNNLVGGLCGLNYEGTIINSYSTGPVAGDIGIGGFCGDNYYGDIENCYSTGAVNGNESVGGFCGYLCDGAINNCYSTGIVSGNKQTGGFCGANGDTYDSYGGDIINCYSTGSVEGYIDVGGFCGYNRGDVNECYCEGEVTGNENVGGFCGYSRSGDVNDCYCTGAVNGNENVGGFCGSNGRGPFLSGGDIINCYTNSDVNAFGDGYNIGGFCGENFGCYISNCYSRSDVNASGDISRIGGFYGSNSSYMTGFGHFTYGGTFHCYSIGDINVCGDPCYVGGFCGYNSTAYINNSFWDVNSSEMGTSGDDNHGATGKTAVEMQTESTFTDAGWDFDPDDGDAAEWWVNEGRDYPKLIWQPYGDLNNDSRVDMLDIAVMGLGWFSGDGDVNFNSVCELSGDWVIDEADLLEVGVMWLAGPGW